PGAHPDRGCCVSQADAWARHAAADAALDGRVSASLPSPGVSPGLVRILPMALATGSAEEVAGATGHERDPRRGDACLARDRLQPTHFPGRVHPATVHHAPVAFGMDG